MHTPTGYGFHSHIVLPEFDFYINLIEWCRAFTVKLFEFLLDNKRRNLDKTVKFYTALSILGSNRYATITQHYAGKKPPPVGGG